MGFYSVVTYLSQSVNTNTDVYYRQRACLKHDLAPTCLCGRKTSRHQFYIIGCVFQVHLAILLRTTTAFADTFK